MIDEKDPVALELKARYRKMPMPNLGLNDVDANDLIEYLTEQDKAVASRESAKSPAAKKP